VAALAPGKTIGPYQIVSAIGAGGMGEVYRARDTRLDRDVAIKVLPDSFSADPDRLARFTREARTLAALNHTNIAHIHGLEESDGLRALVMEFVDGEDLSGRIARGPIPLEESLAIARQIAEALETAHEQGIVHRDLKPANIKVRPDGAVKVLDFGLAKALSPDDASAASNAANSPTLTAHATELGVILGTAAYMSPEQAKGKAVDRRADIWAFGVVFYEMLSGRRGYQAEDISETLAAVLTREVDWSALPAATPPRLRVLLRDCLARDPRQRLRDIGEARRVLDRLINGPPDALAPEASSEIAPIAAHRRNWWGAVPWAIAAIAVLVAGGMYWQLRSRTEDPRPTVTRSRTILKGLAGFVALSRDGTQLAYTSAGQDYQLMLRRMDQFEATPLRGTELGEFPIFSPDGAWIAFSTRGTPGMIKKVPVAGGPPVAVGPGRFLRGAVWGPDDTIVFGAAKGLMRIAAGAGEAQSLTAIDTSKGETGHREPQFLPGGDRLFFTMDSNASDSPHFAVLDMKSGAYRTVARGGDNGQFLHSGHLAFGRNRTLFATPFNLDSLTATGPEVALVEGISTLGPVGMADFTVSETGTLVYMESRGGGATLAWATRAGGIQPLSGQESRSWTSGRLSPDGRRFVGGITAGRDTDLWVVDLVRGVETRLTFGGENDFPVWTPDGRRVVYGATNAGKYGVYSIAADGSGQPTLLVATESLPRPTSFTPDGKALLFTQDGSLRSPRVMVLPLAAGGSPAPRALRESAAADTQAEVSPDDKWVALTSTETGEREVYVVQFPEAGAKVRISTDGGQLPRWFDRGRELLYWTTSVGEARLMSVSIKSWSPPTVSAPRVLFSALSPSIWDVAPDGRILLETLPHLTGGSAQVTVTNWFEELRRKAPAKQ
jgi:serine/threonine protein kinase/Tol biopolymer transport system component